MHTHMHTHMQLTCSSWSALDILVARNGDESDESRKEGIANSKDEGDEEAKGIAQFIQRITVSEASHYKGGLEEGWR